MRRIFRGFCIHQFGIGPLHYISSHSDFDFEFAEIFVIEKRLPDSPSRGVTNSPTRRVCESFFDYEYLREFEAKIGRARKVLWGIYEEPISAKTPENPPHCHVPLIGTNKYELSKIVFVGVARCNTRRFEEQPFLVGLSLYSSVPHCTKKYPNCIPNCFNHINF